MKKEEKFDNIAHRYNSRIDRVENAKRHNLSLAAYFRNRGKADYAAQYETIAASNQAKIDKLKAQKTAELNKIADDMEKSISNNNEMSHIPDAYLDIEQIPRI